MNALAHDLAWLGMGFLLGVWAATVGVELIGAWLERRR